MNKQEAVLQGLRELYHKMAWVNKSEMENALKGNTSVEVHYIEYIGSHEDCNVTNIANALYMTRGAISKMTRKLVSKGLVESYQKPDNKKEIYFKLTSKGQDIYRIHEDLHQKHLRRDAGVFDQLSDETFEEMMAFISRYCRHLDQIKASE